MSDGQVVASLNAEQEAPTVGPGLMLSNLASVTLDPALLIGGKGSVRLTNYGTAATNPAFLALQSNTIYVVELQYRIVSPGSDDRVLNVWMQPTGTTDFHLSVNMASTIRNAAMSGTFSAGAQTGGAPSYQLYISASADSAVVIDNISIYRKDAVESSTVPPAYSALENLPFPRLGKWILGTPESEALSGGAEPPLTYSVEQIEGRLAFNDVILGLDLLNETNFPDSLRRIRLLNPNAVMLPYRISEEQETNIPAPSNGNTSLQYDFLQGIANEWYVRSTTGKLVSEVDFPFIFFMNISPFCPVVNGQTFSSYLTTWLTGKVFRSGMWDGVAFDNLFARSTFPNDSDPSMLNNDWNRNGLRDETPALSSEMTRTAARNFLQDLQNKTGGLQLIAGNAGPLPELHLAELVNGYFFEGFNYNWNAPYMDSLSPAGWRAAFDVYKIMQTTVRRPRINVIEGAGQQGFITGREYFEPTADDIHAERFTMGTALLSDGFYSYDLHGVLSAPLWFDEYSVDSNGTAVEDRSKKGYLGGALSDAKELTTAGSTVFQEDFESGVVPASFIANPPSAVSVSQSPGEVIHGIGSLIITSPDHTSQGSAGANTNPDVVPLAPSTDYFLTFDWRVLETLDAQLVVDVFNSTPSVDVYRVPGVVTGDSGTVSFPFTTPATGNWTIRFAFAGGGKLAIDNVRVQRGGAGPWRRDFENGFVLVNPFRQPHTFSPEDLASPLHRAKIRRINGTQAPAVNNGQPVNGSLTLGPFDAIILLADRIKAKRNGQGQLISD